MTGRLAPHGGCNWRGCRECFPAEANPSVVFTVSEVATALQILAAFPPEEKLLNDDARAVLLKVKTQMGRINATGGNGTLRIV
jgi:hypothetical protein